MANQISGKVIAVSGIQSVASADASKAPLQKRSIYIDCTRYDPYTGERSQYENKPVLEFSGEKLLEKINPKLNAIKQGDIVTISFDIQGMSYVDKSTGKTKNFTGIRAYDIEVKRTADGRTVAPVQTYAPVVIEPQQQQPAPAAQSPFVGEDNKSDLPF